MQAVGDIQACRMGYATSTDWDTDCPQPLDNDVDRGPLRWRWGGFKWVICL